MKEYIVTIKTTNEQVVNWLKQRFDCIDECDIEVKENE